MTLLSPAAADPVHCTEAKTIAATAHAAGVRDGATIRLADGAEVRLASVIAPAAHDGDAAAVARAATALSGLVAGRTIALRGATTRDRYGRQIAQVSAGDPPRWIQAALVREGYVRVAPGTGEPGCAAALLALEHGARAKRIGLWGEPRFAAIDAEALPALLAAVGRYAVVEGSIRRVGEAGGRIYLDFGPRFTQDFTVVIPRAAQGAFAAAGIDLRGLSGKRVRVRGVLYSWGGPAMDIRVPAALERIGADGG